jgi:hypothetical protein
MPLEPTHSSSHRFAELGLKRDNGSENMLSIPEDAESMRQILSFVYPCGSAEAVDISNTTLARHIHLLRISTKYEFNFVTEKLAGTLAQRAESNPPDAFTIFAIGRVLYLPELVQRASTACLQCEISQLEIIFPSESEETVPRVQPLSIVIERETLENLTLQFNSVDYRRLLKFYRMRTQQAIEIVQGYTQKPPASDLLTPLQSKSHECTLEVQESVRWLLLKELENKGPDLRKLLERDFEGEIYDRAEFCANCVAIASVLVKPQIEYDIISRMDALPGFAAMFGQYGVSRTG